MLTINVNVIRDGAHLCSCGIDLTQDRFERIPIKQLMILNEARPSDEQLQQLAASVLDFFYSFLLQVEEQGHPNGSK